MIIKSVIIDWRYNGTYSSSKVDRPLCNIEGSCDYLIGAGVSNWGCYALISGLKILLKDKYAGRYMNYGLNTKSGVPEHKLPEKMIKYNENLLDYDENLKILELCENFDLRDGIDFSRELSVDGMSFGGEHRVMIEELNTIVKE